MAKTDNSNEANVETTTINQRIGYSFFSAGTASFTINFHVKFLVASTLISSYLPYCKTKRSRKNSKFSVIDLEAEPYFANVSNCIWSSFTARVLFSAIAW